MAKEHVHTLKGLACRKRVAAASSPATTCKQDVVMRRSRRLCDTHAFERMHTLSSDGPIYEVIVRGVHWLLTNMFLASSLCLSSLPSLHRSRARQSLAYLDSGSGVAQRLRPSPRCHRGQQHSCCHQPSASLAHARLVSARESPLARDAHTPTVATTQNTLLCCVVASVDFIVSSARIHCVLRKVLHRTTLGKTFRGNLAADLFRAPRVRHLSSALSF
jgi:hypothetical protein